jgi:hypothetical protein
MIDRSDALFYALSQTRGALKAHLDKAKDEGVYVSAADKAALKIADRALNAPCNLCQNSGVVEQEDELGTIAGYTSCPEGCSNDPSNAAHPDWKAS